MMKRDKKSFNNLENLLVSVLPIYKKTLGSILIGMVIHITSDYEKSAAIYNCAASAGYGDMRLFYC